MEAKEGVMSPGYGKALRGSAAFFAMLLAASSGLTTEGAGMEAPCDPARNVPPHALGGLALLQLPSKFTRRRLKLAWRATKA